MKIKKNSLLLAVITLAMLSSAHAITIVNSTSAWLGQTKTQVTTTHNGTTQLSFDATGASKLVVMVATEPGNNNQHITSMALSFNNVTMTQAVLGNNRGDVLFDSGGVAIFYLDNPFQGAATFTSTVGSTGGQNGGIVSIFSLSGTAAGVGNTSESWTSQTSAGNVSTTITTSANNSWVLGAVQNSGTNNSAGTPTVLSPLTLGHSAQYGSSGGWNGAASGHQTVADSATSITPTFTTNAGGNIQIVSAEFLAIPEPSIALLGGLGMFALLRRRR